MQPLREQIAFLEIQIDQRLRGDAGDLRPAQERALSELTITLDTHCPGWYLAVNHDANIDQFRRGYWTYLTAKIIFAMSPEQAVLFKMFQPENCNILNQTVRPRVHYMARIAAGSTVQWKGPLKDFPAELLGATAREHLDRETSNALLNGRRMFELPIGFAGSWPCWN